jgi:DNA processing protein
LIEGVEDILEEILPQAGLTRTLPEQRPPISTLEAMPGEPDRPPTSFQAKGARLGETESKLLPFITQEPVNVDTLIAASGLTAHEVQSSLLVLELGGIVRQLPGKLFLRKE